MCQDFAHKLIKATAFGNRVQHNCSNKLGHVLQDISNHFKMFYMMWKALIHVVVQRRPLRMRNHLSSDSIAVVQRWSNATGGSFSLFPRSSSSIVHQLCPKAISAPTLPNIIHTTKTRPLWEDGKGFWGGWGAGGLSEHSRQPLSVTTTMQCVANIQCIMSQLICKIS